MNRANAGGILLIGIGVVLLNLAYSGRGLAVWQALAHGQASGNGTGTPGASGSDAATAASNAAISAAGGVIPTPGTGGPVPASEKITVPNPVSVFRVEQPTARLVTSRASITAADATGLCHQGMLTLGLWNSKDPRNYCADPTQVYSPAMVANDPDAGASGSGGAGVMLPALGYVGEGGSVTWMDRVWS